MSIEHKQINNYESKHKQINNCESKHKQINNCEIEYKQIKLNGEPILLITTNDTLINIYCPGKIMMCEKYDITTETREHKRYNAILYSYIYTQLNLDVPEPFQLYKKYHPNIDEWFTDGIGQFSW